MSDLFEKRCPDCEAVFSRDTHICPHDGSQLAVTVINAPSGHKLTERYEIVSEIGRGGMGVIYRAIDHEAETPDKKYVAIKLLLSEAAENITMRNRFMNEARAASMLSHPNIVSIKEYAVSSDGLPYMVMDFLEGVPLQDLIDDDGLSRELTLRLLIDVCDALAHAHWRNIVHRDIKPSNIMVLNDKVNARAVLVDFGIAKIFSQPGQVSMKLTQTGEVFGSPLYMSPEQCMGQKLDSRSDIYSMGCVLYECATGQPPFSGSSFMKVVLKHVNDDPEPFAVDAYDTVIESIVLKAMAKDVDSRFATILEMKEQLQYCLELLTNDNINDYNEFLEARANQEDSLAYQQLVKEAEGGNANAQLDLAYLFSDPESAAFNPEAAMNWCKMAAESELPTAQALLGDFYVNEIVTAKDENLAFYWYSKAALAEHSGAERLIGDFYMKGICVEADKETALYWLRRSSLHDDIESQYFLAGHLHSGEFLDQDLEEAVKWYEAAALLGMAEAQYELALCYSYGTGVEPDQERYTHWLTLAAEQGLVEAKARLAECYFDGSGVRQDKSLALELMKEAADAEEPNALMWMGWFYSQGFHKLPRDDKKAVRYFKDAAELEHSVAMYYLGYHYLNGLGVKQDYKTAVMWLKKAIAAGNNTAKYQLALCFRDGTGVVRDQARFRKLLLEAAQADVTEAQEELAHLEE